MKKTSELLTLVLFALSLTACPGKKGDSNGSAATPDTTSVCEWNWQYNNYVDANNNTCTPTQDQLNSSNYCHNYTYNTGTGKWQDGSGNVVNCNPGYIDFNNFQPYQVINYGNYQANCRYYGPGWFPMQFGYSLVCVKQTYFNNYFPQSHNPYSYGGYSGYGYGQSGYYPYSCRYGVDCYSSCGGASAGGNFGGLWFGGTLGICF
jgi:hypothetical protein